jgi:hypothetical protein
MIGESMIHFHGLRKIVINSEGIHFFYVLLDVWVKVGKRLQVTGRKVSKFPYRCYRWDKS